MINALNTLLTGPIFQIINKLIPDTNLKRKLKAEIKKSILNTQNQIVNAQKDVILEEYKHDGILTRNWRPALMILAGFIIAFYGLILPTVQLFVEKQISFQPMWNQVPEQIWEILKWGIGGYIGGRSLEKISKNVTLISKERQKQKTYTHNKIENSKRKYKEPPK